MDVEKLIELVKKNPILYVKERKGYRNDNVKAKIWENIGKELNTPGNKCKYKWKGLRTQYAREEKMQKFSSGSGCEKKKEWKYFMLLKFLDDPLIPKRTHININEVSNSSHTSSAANSPPTSAAFYADVKLESDDKLEDSFCGGTYGNYNSTLASRPNRRESDAKDRDSFSNFYKDFIEEVRRHEEKPDEIDLFFQSLSKIVKSQNLTSLQFLHLQTRITSFLKDELENM